MKPAPITEINTPIIPDILAKNINTSRHIFIGFATSLLMNISSLIAVIAMTITIIGLTKPACTAASPKN